MAGAAIAFTPAVTANAQVARHAQSSSASQVRAEVIKGKLASAEGKPGDSVVLRLESDVKANGEVVLKKGTMLTGVARSIKSAAADAQPRAQAAMQVEWIVPAAGGANGARTISFALQSIRQVIPVRQEQEHEAAGIQSMSTLTSSSWTTVSRSNPALLSMPSVMPVDVESRSAIEADLGTQSGGQLFKVGRGHLVNAGGAQQAVEIFSHLNNDTVITATGGDFEISAGAQMQLLVGVNKN
jgi:hypothetical protein